MGRLGRLRCGKAGKAEVRRGFLSFSTLYQNFTRKSLEIRRNFELEHLNKGDSHNSAFPQWETLAFFVTLACLLYNKRPQGARRKAARPAQDASRCSWLRTRPEPSLSLSLPLSLSLSEYSGRSLLTS